MGSVKVETVSTVPIDGQKTGTSGLRKTVSDYSYPVAKCSVAIINLSYTRQHTVIEY